MWLLPLTAKPLRRSYYTVSLGWAPPRHLNIHAPNTSCLNRLNLPLLRLRATRTALYKKKVNRSVFNVFLAVPHGRRYGKVRARRPRTASPRERSHAREHTHTDMEMIVHVHAQTKHGACGTYNLFILYIVTFSFRTHPAPGR